MPTSNLALALDVLALVDQVPHESVLDIGAGHGKYAVLLREYLNDPPLIIDAAEAWEPYIALHNLAALYRDVIGGPAELLDAGFLADYDVVLMVDVIEHIDKDAALSLLSRIAGHVVICTPVVRFDNDPDGVLPPTEAHVSHWSEADFAALNRPSAYYQKMGGHLVRLGPKEPG